jgi:expansin (peptidoglycan-binding protein)
MRWAFWGLLGLPAWVACGAAQGGMPQVDGGASVDAYVAVDPVGPITSHDVRDAGDAAKAAKDGGLATYGAPYTDGVFNLGPVDYAETAFHNACAPGTKYDPRVQAVEGTMLAGLWGNIPNVAGYCDACILVKTAKGKSALLRVVTYGETTPDSIDTSPQAYAVLNSSEYPRSMTWEFAECPATGPMLYEVQTGSSQWWTSLWVRNARVPLAKVEVKSANHATWTPLVRGTDGTLTDAAGFGVGPFSIRSTGADGQVVIDSFAWPSAGIAGAFLTGKSNFN